MMLSTSASWNTATSTNREFIKEERAGPLAVEHKVNNIPFEVRSQNMAEPVPFDIDTPEGSQPENYPWANEKLQIIFNHLNYHNDMSAFLSLACDGPDIDVPMPKPPKDKLTSLFGPTQEPKKPLIGRELHEYLVINLVNFNDVSVPSWNPTSLEDVKNTLQVGYNILKQHNARLIGHYLKFGNVLNNAFDYFSVSQLKGEVSPNLTWAKWVKDNTNISNSYCKQMRSIAKDFGQYHKFYYLGISFKEFSKRKEHIRLMFCEFPDLTNYWRQNIPPQ